jgi:membrane protein implicated in regulation of membrane protease activity
MKASGFLTVYVERVEEGWDMLDFLSSFSSFTTLNCVYFFMLLAGVIWTAIVLIGGAVASVHVPDVDVDVPAMDLPGDVDIPNIDFHVDSAPSFDHGSVEASPLSPITIASFVTSFGGIGLIGTQLLRLPDTISLVFAAAGAAAIAGGMFLFYSRILVAGQGSSEIRLSDIGGKKAEVIIPIPRNGLGQVAFVTRGTRTTWGARSADGKPIQRGTIVDIESVTGNTVIVRRA